MANTICIYDYNCPDGFGAAYVVRHACPPSYDVEFFPGRRHLPTPNVIDKDVIMVDFVYDRDTVSQMARSARSILIIDHHKTAIEDLKGIEEEFTNVTCVFDIEHSGCVLTWQYYYPNQTIPKLLLYIEDVDLWKHELPNSREVMAAVYSHPYNFQEWYYLMETPIAELIIEGKAIDRKHLKDVYELIENGMTLIQIDEYVVPSLNVPYTMVNDVGAIMSKNYPFAMMWMYQPSGIKVSLRSSPDGVDVSAIAKKYGGGGHKHAAAYLLPSYIDLYQLHKTALG